MADYVAPTRHGDGFNCPHCGAFAHQMWVGVAYQGGGPGFRMLDRADLAFCARCHDQSVWMDGRMVFPPAAGGPLPNPDMPDDAKADYNEARDILARSPRGACALLRLAVQKLCIELEEPGKDLNTDIGALVKRGLLPYVQQALDAVRVIGNEAVHPGEIDLRDDSATASALFGAINIIVEQLITAPKHAEALYGMVPEGKRAAIEERDG